MPRYAPNKMPADVRRRYFELIHQGLSGAEAARRVGVSLSCGSLDFLTPEAYRQQWTHQQSATPPTLS
jgi:transposase, IS30 family